MSKFPKLMPKYMVIIVIPRRQGLLTPIPEKVTVSEVETDDIETYIASELKVPLTAVAYVIPTEEVRIVTAKIVNDIQQPKDA